MKKTFLKEILRRRVPQIIGSYLIASISLIGALDWLVARYEYSETYVTLAIFCLISILPSVVILSYFHGAPGKDEWTKVEKYGIPVNVLFIALAIFFGKKFESHEVDNIQDTFYYFIDSREVYVDLDVESVIYKEYLNEFNPEDIEQIDVLNVELLEELWNEIPPLINAKIARKDINVYTPQSKQERDLVEMLPGVNHVYNTYMQGDTSAISLLEDKTIKDLKELDKKLDKKHNINIDGYIVVYLTQLKIKNLGWASIYNIGYWFIDEEDDLNLSISSQDFVDFQNKDDDSIINEIARELGDFIEDQRYGDTRIGIVDEILSDDLVSVKIENENIQVLKGSKLEQWREYRYDSNDIDNIDVVYDKKLDDLNREKEYILENPTYILDESCESCLAFNKEAIHDKLNTKELLQEYLKATNIEIDSLVNYRDVLLGPFILKDQRKKVRVEKKFTLNVVKVTDSHIIAKIIEKNAEYIIPKVDDSVFMIID